MDASLDASVDIYRLPPLPPTSLSFEYLTIRRNRKRSEIEIEVDFHNYGVCGFDLQSNISHVIARNRAKLRSISSAFE
jgi:hypothetical protein